MWWNGRVHVPTLPSHSVSLSLSPNCIYTFTVNHINLHKFESMVASKGAERQLGCWPFLQRMYTPLTLIEMNASERQQQQQLRWQHRRNRKNCLNIRDLFIIVSCHDCQASSWSYTLCTVLCSSLLLLGSNSFGAKTFNFTCRSPFLYHCHSLLLLLLVSSSSLSVHLIFRSFASLHMGRMCALCSNLNWFSI